MRYVQGLIPKEARVLQDHFESQAKSKPMGSKVLTIILRILAWIGGMFILLGSISMFKQTVLASILMLITGFIIIPPGHKLIERVLRFKFPLWLKSIIVFILIITFSFIIGDIQEKKQQSAPNHKASASIRHLTFNKKTT